MNDVIIEPTAFDQAALLGQLIARRHLPVQLGQPTAEAPKAPILVYSAGYESQLGGAQALLAQARALRPHLVVVIDPLAPAFSIEEELGGKLLRIGFAPTSSADVTSHYGLLVCADLICRDQSKMVAADPQTTALLELAARVARTDVSVFINGPTGTGKEVMARFIHDRSLRKEAPFVAINCAAIPENMLEAILFGHEKGAFTGASVANKGIFRAADGGTLLLDEISEMPIGLQSKLLRVLQERKVTPIGTQKEIEVDIRVIATTNRDMPTEVREGRFREDLFYRLNVFPLALRALGERPQDIPAIATALLRKHLPQGQSMPWLTDAAMARLLDYNWPGNVRELENAIQRAMVLHMNGAIEAEDIILDTGSALSLSTQAALKPQFSLGAA